MYITGVLKALLRIRYVYPGSRIRIKVLIRLMQKYLQSSYFFGRYVWRAVWCLPIKVCQRIGRKDLYKPPAKELRDWRLFVFSGSELKTWQSTFYPGLSNSTTLRSIDFGYSLP